MLLPIEYQIGFVEGEYHLYMLVDNVCAVLHSSYRYRPCYEVMQVAKHSQILGNASEV